MTKRIIYSKQEVEQKLNIFFIFNILTQEEYTKLMQLAEEKYKETTIEETIKTE